MSSEQQQLRPYKYSIGIEASAKAFVQPSIRVNSDDVDTIAQIVRFLLNEIISKLRDDGYKIATDIKSADDTNANSNKNGK